MLKKSGERSKRYQKQNKESVAEKLCRCMDLPSDLANGNLVEIRGRGSVSVCGCRKILLYSHDRIELEGKEFDTVIVGKRLEFTGFGDKCAEVCGLVDRIEFRRRDEGCL
ncbi:MAG: YabP/YqfC family sporulation protein [Clostridia bacterium]|nr:YabP/YqfC family sporulation protein [Clostridia bacterium]MBQ4327257.1 YabP/YqfC family sporulation protein [Clostridia bacterium]